MELKKAAPEDFTRIRDFYRYVIENTPTMHDCCCWVYGLHPTDELLRHYIGSGFLYYFESDGSIVAAIAVTDGQGEEYHGIPWQKALADHEVTTGHLMCVDPARTRQGIARALLEAVCALTAQMGKKAYRLDTLDSNKPAQAMYDALGFKRIAVKRWYMANTGWSDFILYEKLV